MLIHIGYPKTASSWLQSELFINSDFGFISPWGSPTKKAINLFCTPNYYDFDPKMIRKIFVPGLKEAEEKGLFPVISHENLSENTITRQGTPAFIVCDKLNKVFPEAKILLFIREQKSLIYSSYQQYVKMGGSLTIEQYMGVNVNQGFMSVLPFENLHYHYLIKEYQDKFGQENVLVIPFESFKKSNLEVLKKILNFAGIDHDKAQNYTYCSSKNVSLKPLSIAFVRQINCMLPRPETLFAFNNSSRLSYANLYLKITGKSLKIIENFELKKVNEKIKTNWEKKINDVTKDMFKESNKKTSELIGIDLSKIWII